MNSIVAALSPAVEHVAKSQSYATGDRPRETVLVTRPSNRMTTLGHCVLIFALYASFAAVVAVEVARYVTSTPRIERGVTVSSRFAQAIPLTVTPRCLSADTAACGSISVTVNYTHPETPAACKATSSSAMVKTAIVAAGSSLTVPLCYVPDEPWTTFLTGGTAPASSGVYVSFNPLSPSSTVLPIVDVSSDGYAVDDATPSTTTTTTASLSKRMNIGHAEVRTLLVGAREVRDSGRFLAVKPYATTFETDGYRIDNRSDVFIRLIHFAEVENRVAKETIVELIAGFGGAFKLLRIAAIVLVPVMYAVFAKDWSSMKSSDESTTKAVNRRRQNGASYAANPGH